MKRFKGSQTPAFAHPLEFYLMDPLDSATGPGDGPMGDEEEDRTSFGGWYQGRVCIVSCPRERALEGLHVYAYICGRLPSRAPYWIYQCAKGIQLNVDAVLHGRSTDNAMRIPREAAVCMPTRMKPLLDKGDVLHLLGECTPSFSLGCLQWQAAAEWITKGMENKTVPSAWSAWQLRFPWIMEHSQLTRAPMMGALFDSFLHPYVGHDAQKQRRILGALPVDTLRELVTIYQNRPWELLWGRTMRRQFGGLKGLRALPDHCAMNRVPLLEQTAIRFLNALRFAQNDKHTIFAAELFRGTIPCLPQDYRARFEPQLIAYLHERDMVFCGPSRSFGEPLALHADFQTAELIIGQLELIRQRNLEAHRGPLLLRSRDKVPCIPPRLTEDQHRIAQHVTQHWLTIVLGSPGTGKTALLTWVLSHYRAALSTGFVGRLVKMLQKRNGRRPELAYTIDAILYAATKSPVSMDAARQWLCCFEVLVIDECSNVSMGRIAKLLPLFPNLRKLVLVGDPNQLTALKPGDFLSDMATRFPLHTHRLTENLRVASNLAALQDAPGRILHGRPEEIQWSAGGPISVVPTGGATAANALMSLYSSILHKGGTQARSLLNIQLLALTHKGAYGRTVLNNAFHHVAEQLGILQVPRQRGACVHISKHLDRVYPGCKLTCLKNYNHSAVKEFGLRPELVCYNDPVANGEIFIVHRIWRPPAPARGICMHVYDSSPDEAIKRLWIDEEDGISPLDLDWGYATTVYKSQGGEFPWVVFCVPSDPGDHWTRANAYVAVSRAQQSCVVLGSLSDFNAIAKRPDRVRQTVFAHLLSRHPSICDHVPLAQVPEAELRIVRDPERECKVLKAGVAAAPSLKDFLAIPKQAATAMIEQVGDEDDYQYQFPDEDNFESL